MSIGKWLVVSKYIFHHSSLVLGLFCYVDCHFIIMSPLCTRSLPDFCWLFAFVFSLGCVYLCSHLPCSFDGWVPILDFYLQGFFSFLQGSRCSQYVPPCFLWCVFTFLITAPFILPSLPYSSRNICKLSGFKVRNHFFFYFTKDGDWEPCVHKDNAYFQTQDLVPFRHSWCKIFKQIFFAIFFDTIKHLC